jgi:hypothetical protein
MTKTQLTPDISYNLMFPELPQHLLNIFAIFPFWSRLEPRARSTDLASGVEARVADPLWMLTRQWQVGEFQAEDAGTPIKARVEHKSKRIANIALNDGDAYPVAPVDQLPVQMLAERQKITPDWRLRIQAGQEFERILSEAYPDDKEELIRISRKVLPVIKPSPQECQYIDKDTQRFLRFMAGRVTDGGPILTGLVKWELKDEVIPEEVKTKLTAAAVQVQKWFANFFSQPGENDSSPWKPERLCYRFRQGARENMPGTSLIADEYRNGELDWYNYDIQSLDNKLWSNPVKETSMPARIKLTGTSPRWWAYEDGMTDFGNLDAESTDLVKLAFMEFALIYGDDWFCLPVEAEPGSMCKITSLEVTDVFGITTSIPAARNEDTNPLKAWSLFDLSPCNKSGFEGLANVLFIPQVTGKLQESKVIEEVQFIRDEMANLVWGVEETIPNGIGKPAGGFALHLEKFERLKEYQLHLLNKQRIEILAELNGESNATKTKEELEKELKKIDAEMEKLQLQSAEYKQGDIPLYRLMTPVPENWIPFVPVNATPYEKPGYDWNNPVVDIKLRRGRMLRNTDDEEPIPIKAKSQLMSLDHEALLWLNEETISRAGLKVQLVKKIIRDSNGKSHLWVGKKVLYGSAGSSSGLEFDVF